MGNCCVARQSFKRRGEGGGGAGRAHRGGRLGGANVRSYSTVSSISDAARAAAQTWPPVTVLGKCLAPVASAEELLRRYQLGEELGRGEFGVTQRCTDTATGAVLACKSISKRRLRSNIDIQDVRREVAIMRSLPAHANVVRLREAFEDADAVHLVMEVCEGGELFDRIVARGHYTERAAAAVMRTIMEVVEHCHKHGVMHRDLKPENFLYANASENSPLKAIDFGLSVCFKPETDEGIAQAIIQSNIDFEREPWPKVSENAKDLVRKMLDPSPYARLTAQQVLEHPWIQNASAAPNIPLGEAVRSRLKQFTTEELDAIRELFHMLDTNKDGHLTVEELRKGLQMIGHNVHDTDVDMLMEAADIDGNGTLDCKEFVTVSIHIEIEELKEAISPRGDQKAIDDIILTKLAEVICRPPGRFRRHGT